MLALRFLYGFPLDDEIKDMDMTTIKNLYEAAEELEIKDLRAYALRKMEERLVEEAHNVTSYPEDGEPLPITDIALDPSVDDVEVLLQTDERAEDTDDMSGVMVVVVKVCCTYYAVMRQFESFRALGRDRPRLYHDMLNYVAAKGGDMLGMDPRLGKRTIIDGYLDLDHEE